AERGDGPFGVVFPEGRDEVSVLIAQVEPIEVPDLVAEPSTPAQEGHVRGIAPRRRPRDHVLERRGVLRALAEVGDLVAQTGQLEQRRDQGRVVGRRARLRSEYRALLDERRDQQGWHPATVAIEREAVFQNGRPFARSPRRNRGGWGYVIERA